MTDSSIQSIEKQARDLSLPDHIKLIEALVRQLREKSVPAQGGIDWGDLYGIGKGLWEGQDAQEYVNGIREDR